MAEKEYKFGEPERPEDVPLSKYREADEDIVELAEKLIEKNHPYLKQARILYLVCEDELTLRGKPVPGRVYKVNEREKTEIQKDLEIVISEPIWHRVLEEGNAEAAMDFILCFCTLGKEAGTFTTCDPDFYGFYSNIDRYGTWDRSLKELKKRVLRQKLPFGPDEEEGLYQEQREEILS